MGQTYLRGEETKTLEQTSKDFLRIKEKTRDLFARYREAFKKKARWALVPLALVPLLAACSYQDQRVQDLLNNPATIRLQLNVGETYETDAITKEFSDGSKYFYILRVTHTQYKEYYDNSYPEVEVKGVFVGGSIASIRHSKLWTVNRPKYEPIVFKDSVKDNNKVERTLEFMIETYAPSPGRTLILYLRWDSQLY